jgi:hypothetical protein
MKTGRKMEWVVPLWLLVLLGAGVAAGAVLYTYVTTNFHVKVVENVGVTGYLENNNFLIPDNGTTSVKYTVINASGENKYLTLIGNADTATNNELWYSTKYPWPNGSNKIFDQGTNYGFTIDNGQTMYLRVDVGDSGSAVPNDEWDLQLYLLDNALF